MFLHIQTRPRTWTLPVTFLGMEGVLEVSPLIWHLALMASVGTWPKIHLFFQAVLAKYPLSPRHWRCTWAWRRHSPCLHGAHCPGYLMVKYSVPQRHHSLFNKWSDLIGDLYFQRYYLLKLLVSFCQPDSRVSFIRKLINSEMRFSPKPVRMKW